MNLCSHSYFSLQQHVKPASLESVLFWRGKAGNVYYMSTRLLQDFIRVLIRCFSRLLSTLHRKGRSHAKFTLAEIVLRVGSFLPAFPASL